MSEEYTSTGIAVCVNVSSRKPHSDTTVILQRGDHSFVTHESVINYQDAREMPISLVEEALAKRTTQFLHSTRSVQPGAARAYSRRTR